MPMNVTGGGKHALYTGQARTGPSPSAFCDNFPPNTTPNTCGGIYRLDTVVRLTASEAPDSKFLGWGGACSGNVLTCDGSTAAKAGTNWPASSSARAIRVLAAHGADLEVHDAHGRTPLIEAVTSRAVHAVRTLIEAGARLDAVDDDGRTAGQHAANLGDAEIVRALEAAQPRPPAPPQVR